MIGRFLRQKLSKVLFPRRKEAFIHDLPPRCRVLDVGCGNGSPALAKSIRPDIYYVGLDIHDYNQNEDSKTAADEYIIVEQENFDNGILKYSDQPFDAVISAHNIEHCLQADRVLRAMCSVLKPEGYLYMSFPCEASTAFPSREYTLNFYDDPTHKTVPAWRDILDHFERNDMDVIYASRRHRPIIPFLIGAAVEPVSAWRGVKMPGTWAFYGFESIIWGKKRPKVPNTMVAADRACVAAGSAISFRTVQENREDVPSSYSRWA